MSYSKEKEGYSLFRREKFIRYMKETCYLKKRKKKKQEKNRRRKGKIFSKLNFVRALKTDGYAFFF